MSKRTLIISAALLALAMLAGCRMVTRTDIDFDVNSFSKAQKIVVRDAAGNEKAVLEDQADIDAFVDAASVGGWRFVGELPEGLHEAGSFTLWQRETVTALIGQPESKANEICTFRVYKDGDYLTIEAALMDVTFSIPSAAADRLRGLTA